MADTSTIARPYARALFDIAQRDDTLVDWSAALETAAQVLADDQARAFLSRPHLDDESRVAFLAAVCGEVGDTEILTSKRGSNLLRLLAENDRLAVLAEIALQFEALKARAENTVKVRFITAAAIEADVAAKIKDALEQKLGRAVELQLEEDAELLGGAIIRAEDMVIDGSVKSRLQELAETLIA